MLRKVCVGITIGMLLAANACAQVGAPNVMVSGEVLSKYIWNGFNRVASSGLGDTPVFQPRVDMGVAGSRLQAHVLGSFTLDSDSQLHEAVYGLSTERAVSPLVSVVLGYDYYDDRAAVVATEALDQHEVSFGVKMRTPSGVVPSAVVKYENPVRDGVSSYYVAVGSLKQSLPVVPSVGGSVGVNVSWKTSVLYQTSLKVNDFEVVGSGVTAWQFGLSSEILAGGVLVVPQVNYQVTVDDAVNNENPFWAGLGVAYAF
jgi:hypothetical protein